MNVHKPVRLNQSRWASSASWVIRNFVFPFWVRCDHPAYARYLREFERTQFLPRPALEALQLERLRKLLDHAYENCAFYRRRLDKAGLRPTEVRSLEQVSLLPLLTKREIQDHAAEIQAAHFSESARVRNQTGGSTGSPLQFFVDRERLDSRMASTARHNSWAGLRPGDWQASLWGSRLDQVKQQGLWDWTRSTLLYRSVTLNSSRIRDEDWGAFIAALRQKRPRVLIAYTQAAVLLARYLRQREIEDIHFDSIIPTAEVLLPGQREFLEEVLGGKVFNRYGCREVSVIASECECHQGMHVNAETLLVEVVPDTMFPKPFGRIVITDLLNYSMPLIRYSIGDVGSWAEGPDCPCGRGLPRLTQVQGRTTDFLLLWDGRQVSGPALTLVVADIAELRQVQFVQRARDLIILRVVPGRNYCRDTADELRRRLSLYLGPHTILKIEETESITSEISGKYHFVINELQADSDPNGMAVREQSNLARF